MSIAARINESIVKFQNNELDNSAIQAFIATDGTAKKVLNINANKQRFTRFIEDNLDLISKVMFLIDDIPNEEFLNGMTFAELVYEMRCSILHEGFLNEIIWNEKKLKFENGSYFVPNSLIIALLITAVVQTENINEPIERGLFTEFFYKNNGIRIRYSEFKGEKARLLEKFEHLTK
jgi:hypothetical protein